jgi:UDP-galactopyranose mutase
MCQENSIFIKIWRVEQVIYMKANMEFWAYLAQFLEWETFQTNVVEKVKRDFICHNFFSKILPFVG